MRLFKLLFVAVLLIATSCQEKKQPVKKNITNNIQHYICENKCENSGSNVAGTCKTCNTPYTHNVAFHSKDFLKNGPLNVPKTNLNTNSQTNKTASPAQNTYGVYHYTCTNGCNGGAGTATKCTSCGADLVHNQAYHN